MFSLPIYNHVPVQLTKYQSSKSTVTFDAYMQVVADVLQQRQQQQEQASSSLLSSVCIEAPAANDLCEAKA